MFTRRSFLKNGIILAATSICPFSAFASGKKTSSPPGYLSKFYRLSPKRLLALMIFGEARGCLDPEMYAVGHTAMNRLADGKKRYGETLQEVILKPWQYHCFKQGDPNLRVLSDPEKHDAKTFERCMDISHQILHEGAKDPAGATHYFNPDILQLKKADEIRRKWGDTMSLIGRIKVGETKEGSPIYSAHEFYRER